MINKVNLNEKESVALRKSIRKKKKKWFIYLWEY